jgi:hypothetical protein
MTVKLEENHVGTFLMRISHLNLFVLLDFGGLHVLATYLPFKIIQAYNLKQMVSGEDRKVALRDRVGKKLSGCALRKDFAIGSPAVCREFSLRTCHAMQCNAMDIPFRPLSRKSATLLTRSESPKYASTQRRVVVVVLRDEGTNQKPLKSYTSAHTTPGDKST